MTLLRPASRSRGLNQSVVYIMFSLLAVVSAPAETGSWVFLQDNPDESLVRLSADGKSLTTIAKGAAGLGLAIDAAGNYIVGARKTLLRVTEPAS